MAGKIQVGFLVSYDYELLKTAIPTVYSEADSVFLAIDINRKTWKGEDIFIDPSFFEWIDTYDKDHKIVIYEDDFFVSHFTTMQCEIRERKMLAEKMGIGNWLIQIDADEYFVDFKKFVTTLRKYDSYLINPKAKPIQIFAFWVMLYKYTENGILYVDKPLKAVFATNYPSYKNGRRIKGRQIYTDSIVLHESLSRSEEELRFKLQNWGHNTQINSEFMDKWLVVNEHNYKEYRNFYFIEPERWKKLGFLPTKDIKEVKEWLETHGSLRVSKKKVFFKNLGQRFKFFMKKIKGKV